MSLRLGRKPYVETFFVSRIPQSHAVDFHVTLLISRNSKKLLLFNRKNITQTINNQLSTVSVTEQLEWISLLMFSEWTVAHKDVGSYYSWSAASQEMPL